MVYHAFADQEKGALVILASRKTAAAIFTRQRKRIVVSFDLCTSTRSGKAKQTARGLRVFSTERLYKELKKREPEYDLFGGGVNYYDRFIEDTQLQAIEALKEELVATREAYFELEQRF